MKNFFISVLLVFIFALPAASGFFSSGYPLTDDGLWAVVRQGAMHRAFLAGHLPARWAGNLNFGYGYPLFLFTYPLPFYIGEIFNLIGFGLVGSIKALFVASVFLSALGLFWLAKQFWGFWGGGTAALFYVYAPYRLLNLYSRGSIGESLALVWYPLIFLGLYQVFQGKRFWLGFTALAYAALLTSHNISALLMTPFLLAWAVFLIWQASKKSRWPLAKNFGLIFVLGFGLASFFLLPAFWEKNKIILSQKSLADKTQHFLSLQELVISQKGLGLVHCLALGLASFFWLKRRRPLVFGFFVMSLLIVVLLVLPFSFWFWQLPLFSQVDFPWRFLGPASFFIALAVGWLVTRCRWLVAFLAVLAILANWRFLKPQTLVNYPDTFYLTNQATTTSADELMPIWVRQKPVQPADQIVQTGAVLSQLHATHHQIKFIAKASTPAVVQLSIIYFPGWQVKVDGKQVPISYENAAGLISFSLPAGQSEVVAEFAEIPRWLAADLLSLASLFFVSSLLVRSKNENLKS